VPAVFIPFGPFEPDSAEINSGATVRAAGVAPSKNGFTFLRGSGTSHSSTSFAPGSKGACLIDTGSGTWRVYAHRLSAGTHSIRSLDSTGTGIGANGTEVGTGFSAPPTNEFWRFTKFGNFLIAGHGNQAPQVLNWSSAGSLGALGGSPPTATGWFTIHDFVFATGLASNRRKLQWSAINDHTGWTVGTNLSGDQEFPDGGDVCGIAGGMSGFVIQRNAIRSYQFLPGDTAQIFSFHKIDGIPGASGLHAWAVAGNEVIYYSEEGFCRVGRGGFRRIGSQRVDEYIKGKITNTLSVVAQSDPYHPRIFFFFVSSDNVNRIIYDWHLDKFSELEDANVQVPVIHLDETGGGARQAIFGDAILASLAADDGSFRAVTITTAEMVLFQSGPHACKRARIDATRPVANGAVTSMIVMRRNLLTDAVTSVFSDVSSPNANGKYTYGTNQTSGNYHAIQLLTPSSGTATYFKGAEVWAEPDGEA
jgi:hypothetical protein